MQALNPRVNLSTETNARLLFDEDYLSQFDLVVVTDVDAPTLVSFPGVRTRASTRAASLVRVDPALTSPKTAPCPPTPNLDSPGSQLSLNALTRKLGKRLFAAGSIGLDGWMFADLLSHDYVV